MAEQAGIKKSIFIGVAIGIFHLTMFCAYGLAFWYGAKLVVEDGYTPGQKVAVFLSVTMGAFGLAQFGQNVEYMATAQTAAFTVFQLIDRTPDIDTHSEEGIKLDSAKGIVEFKNVTFKYPSRTDHDVLNNVSFQIEGGKTVAL